MNRTIIVTIVSYEPAWLSVCDAYPC